MRRWALAAVAGDEGGDGGTKRGMSGEDAMLPGLVLAGWRDQRDQATEKGDGGEHELGLAGEPRPAQPVGDLARRGQAQAAVGEGWAGAVTVSRSP